jgi:hypothetical protein
LGDHGANIDTDSEATEAPRFKRLAPKQVQPLFGGKKSGRFGTSNNILSLAFTFLINRTQKFLVTYYNSCKIRLPFYILVVSYSFKNVKVFLVFTQGPTSAILFSAKESPNGKSCRCFFPSLLPSFSSTVQVDADATRDHFGATVGGAPGLTLVSSKLAIWVTTDLLAYRPNAQHHSTAHLNVTTLKI